MFDFGKFERLPALISWCFLIVPFLCIRIFPEAVAIFFIIYTLFWLIQGTSYTFFLLKSYHIYKKQISQNWEKILAQSTPVPHIDKYLEKYVHGERLSIIKAQDTRDVYHIVIVASYKEPYEVLQDTMNALKNARYSKDRIIIVFALEERDEINAVKNVFRLKQEFSDVLPHIYYSVHPKNIVGEVIGKGGNIAYAAKTIIPTLLRKYNIKKELALVSIPDADHLVHPDYFSVLTYTFLRNPQRQHFSYQPLPFLYNNFWKVPIFVRLVAVSSTFWHLLESARKDKIRNFAAHAQPLSALIEMDYWATTTIVEDGHQFWRSYTHFKGEYAVVPLYIPIYQDAVEKEEYLPTLKAQYIQLRRWAHGAEDVGYIASQLFAKDRKVPFWRTMYYMYQLLQSHVMWATAPLLLTFSTPMALLFSASFTTSPVFYNFFSILQIYFTISMIGIVISIWMSFIILPKPPKTKTLGKRLVLWLSIGFQWFLLPITTVLLSAIPALEAQTRILFGKKVGFVVTEKRR